jgi:hypothetical protein
MYVPTTFAYKKSKQRIEYALNARTPGSTEHRKYTILLMITYGEISDTVSTKQAIIEVNVDYTFDLSLVLTWLNSMPVT